VVCNYFLEQRASCFVLKYFIFVVVCIRHEQWVENVCLAFRFFFFQWKSRGCDRSFVGLCRLNTQQQETMAEASKTDFSALPDDAILHAFYFLEAEHVCKLAAVSKRVGTLSENNNLWRYLVEKEWGKHTPEQEKQLLEDQIEWEKRIAERKAAAAAK
jgi:hypothetical protein